MSTPSRVESKGTSFRETSGNVNPATKRHISEGLNVQQTAVQASDLARRTLTTMTYFSPLKFTNLCKPDELSKPAVYVHTLK